MTIIPPIYPLHNQPQQGWQCPCCGRIYSPLTPMCFHCGGNYEITCINNATSEGTIKNDD